MQTVANIMPYVALLFFIIAKNKGTEIMEETADAFKKVKSRIDDINPS